MPLNTSEKKEFNLPAFRTSTNQANPYIEIHGTLNLFSESGRKRGPIIHLEISKKVGDKKNAFEAAFDIRDNSGSIIAESDLPLRLEDK